MRNSNTSAFLQAMIANFFWGFGFTATIWALSSFSMGQVLFVRFAVVGMLGLIYLIVTRDYQIKHLLRLTFIPAIFLLIEILFQVWGLKYTSATNAGFLTVTYILMIPVLEKVLKKRAIEFRTKIAIIIGLLGTLMMIEFKFTQPNLGDLLMLGSALGASLHMIRIDSIGKTETRLFVINALQSFWGMLIVIPILLIEGSPMPAQISLLSMIGLGSITFGSTMLAFYFQMKAQKELTPTISSLMFLIESPLAAGFGFVFLSESLSGIQIFGCFMILLAAFVATRKNKIPT